MGYDPSRTSPVELSRRDALKGLGAIGAGAAIGSQHPALVSALQQSSRDPYLPVEMVREFWYDTTTAVDDLQPESILATRGVAQTNLRLVDEDQEWRHDCGDRAGVHHRFTTVGYYRGVDGASLDVSIDDESCGAISLTPFYTWEGYQDFSAIPPNSEPPSSPGALESEVREEFDQGVLEPDEPGTFESFLQTAGMVTGVLKLVPFNVPFLGQISTALTVAGFVASLLDAEPTVYRRYHDDAIEASITDGSFPDIRFLWADFDVVVPSGGDPATVSVTHSVDIADNRTHVPRPDDVTFSIDVPSNDGSTAAGNANVASISMDNAPIRVTDRDDREVSFEATLPHSSFGTPDWGDQSGHEITTEFDSYGPTSVSYVATDEHVLDFEYRASRSVLVGTPPFEGQPRPDVSVTGPRNGEPGTELTVWGSATSANGDIVNHEWILEEDQNPLREEAEWVEIDSSERDGEPGTYVVDQPEGVYRLVLSVNDGYEVGQAIRVMTIREDVELDLEIEGPDVVAVGSTETFEFGVETSDGDDVEWNALYWSGDAIEADPDVTGVDDPSPEITLEEAGEYDLELTYTAANGIQETATHAVVAVEAFPDVELSGPSDVEPNEAPEITADVSSPNGDIVAHEWVLEVDENATRESEKWVQIDSVSGDGEPAPFELDEPEDVYQIRLTVTDAVGATAEAIHVVSVREEYRISVEIDGPAVVSTGSTAEFSFDAETDDGEAVSWNALNWSGEPITADPDVTGVDDPSPEITFEEAGEYDLELTVTDARSVQGTATHTVDVEPPADPDDPTVTIEDSTGGSIEVEAGSEATFEADASTDTGVSVERYSWKLTYYPPHETTRTTADSLESTDSNEFATDEIQMTTQYNLEVEVVDEAGGVAVDEVEVNGV